jgi:hypothetical protein
MQFLLSAAELQKLLNSRKRDRPLNNRFALPSPLTVFGREGAQVLRRSDMTSRQQGTSG